MAILETELFRRHTAYHQAGHVIADLVSGYRFTFVTIKPDLTRKDDEGVCGNARGRARDLAVVQLAGIVSAAQKTGHDPGRNLTSSMTIVPTSPLPGHLLMTGLDFSPEPMGNHPSKNSCGMRYGTRPGC